MTKITQKELEEILAIDKKCFKYFYDLKNLKEKLKEHKILKIEKK